MKIEKKKLIDSLEIARMGVAGSDHLQQLGHFIFGGEHLITFNNRILIYHPFKTDFQCSVRAELFYKQLKKFDSEELDITLKGKKVSIDGTNEHATMSVQLEKDSEIFEIINAIREEQLVCQFISVPEDFTKAVEFCSYSASKNAADGTLCCVCIEGDQLISTDNYRATRYTMDRVMSNEKVLLDARVANEIKRFNMNKFGTGTNWLHFKNKEEVLLSARRIFGDYPDISKAFDFEGEKIRLPIDTNKTLDFVSVLLADLQEPEKRATIEIKDGSLTTSVEHSSESAKKSVDLDKRYGHLEMSFIVNIEFLRSVLEKTQNMFYNLAEKKAMFKSQNFQHVIKLQKEGESVPEVKDVTVPEDYQEDVSNEQYHNPDDDILF